MEKKNKIYSIILAYATGLLLSLFSVIGFVTKHNHGFAMSLSVVFIAVVLTVMIGSAMLAFFALTDSIYLKRLMGKGGEITDSDLKKPVPSAIVFFTVFVIFLICWSARDSYAYPWIYHSHCRESYGQYQQGCCCIHALSDGFNGPWKRIYSV